eukprot:8918072-Pyramimonas_sp.AAC.1
MNAPDDFHSASLIISSVAVLQLELVQKTDSTCQDDSNNTNRFANLAQVADRVQTSRCDRERRLMILRGCL